MQPSMEEIKRAAAGHGAEPLYTQSFWRAAVRTLLGGPVCIVGKVDAADLVLSPHKIWHVEDSKIEARPLDQWHEDIGDVLWWKMPIEESPYCGSPLDTNWPGYHTHWTSFAVPREIHQ